MPFIGTRKTFRILDFDIENRPLSYWGKEPTAEITSIASCWVDDPDSMEVLLLGKLTPDELYTRFLERYNEAGMLVGHYIRGHDLPILNGAMIEYGYPMMAAKLTQDTYLDLKKRKGIPASQEYLVSLLGVGQKVHMTQHDWRQANRLGEKGLGITTDRVAGDVEDNIRLRVELLNRGLLNGPKIWHP